MQGVGMNVKVKFTDTDIIKNEWGWWNVLYLDKIYINYFCRLLQTNYCSQQRIIHISNMILAVEISSARKLESFHLIIRFACFYLSLYERKLLFFDPKIEPIGVDRFLVYYEIKTNE